MEHEILRQIEYIRQTLSQDKKPLGIFISAGCPLGVKIEPPDDGPLIPDVIGLTKYICEESKLPKGKKDKCIDIVLKFFREDGKENPNIEEILSYIRSLKNVVGNSEVRGLSKKDLTDLDKEICSLISKKVDKPLPNKETPYHNLATWITSLQRNKPFEIFTTNYDLLMEQALEDVECPYFDGFVGVRKAFFDSRGIDEKEILPARWTRLWKIHGSLNWRLSDGRVIRTDQVKDGESYLIYPSHLKYDETRKMPYLAMLDNFKNFLKQPSSLLYVIGYSFNDDHINEVMHQSLKTNPTCMIYAFLYGELNQEDNKYHKAIKLSKDNPNFTIIAFDKGVIGKKEGAWILKNEDDINSISGNIVIKDKSSDKVTLEFGDFRKFGLFLNDITNEVKLDDEEL